MTYVGKVILGEHGVGRVSGVVIVEHNVLLVLAALDDLGGAGRELILDLLDDGDDEGSDDLEDKERELLLQLLNDLGKNGDLLDGSRD